MSDLAEFDAEHPQEQLTRRQRAALINSGERGSDGLTDLERVLLVELRRQSYDIARSWMVNVRSGDVWAHRRAVVAIA